jgi:hypothetical protein
MGEHSGTTWTSETAAGPNYRGRVTGNFVGTTDEIIQWASCKWGFDPEIRRAVAWNESSWRMSMVGDNGTSFGLYQVKATEWGGHPNSVNSTAFNADYYMGLQRACYDGVMWFGPALRGNLDACIGVWFSGDANEGTWRRYVDHVHQTLAEKPWTSLR